MVMAGKGTPSEESVPLVCPQCRGQETEQTTRGQIRLDGKPPRDTNRATCRACGITGTVADWELIEQLRRYVGRMLGHDALASQT